MKWEIWTQHKVKRNEIGETEWEDYCETRFREWLGFNKEYIAGLVYRPAGIVDAADVFHICDGVLKDYE